jgi:general L-amino acid transport system permease protein
MPPRAGQGAVPGGWRGVLIQAAFLAALLAVALAVFANARANLAASGIVSGVDFLWQPSGFGINQTLVAYDEGSSYGRVFLVGALNTLAVSVVAIVLASVLGFGIGIARLSANPVLARIAAALVATTRNLPALFHLLFWYVVVLAVLPPARQGFALGEIAFLNVRGLFVPQILLPGGMVPVLLIVVLALLGAALARALRMGRPAALAGAALGLFLGFAATGNPFAVDLPELRGFNFTGGLRLSPEFVVLTFGLSVYTAGYIAEIVRGGIISVTRGQREAARALGLGRGDELLHVVLPQAMRVIIPALTSQYLNIAKNSSLAIAIGYPDLASVFFQTTLHRTGQAVEVVALTMAFYLAISLATSLAMNLYNARVMRGTR